MEFLVPILTTLSIVASVLYLGVKMGKSSNDQHQKMKDFMSKCDAYLLDQGERSVTASDSEFRNDFLVMVADVAGLKRQMLKLEEDALRYYKGGAQRLRRAEEVRGDGDEDDIPTPTIDAGIAEQEALAAERAAAAVPPVLTGPEILSLAREQHERVS